MCDQLAEECIILFKGYYFIQRLDGNKMFSSKHTRLGEESSPAIQGTGK